MRQCKVGDFRKKIACLVVHEQDMQRGTASFYSFLCHLHLSPITNILFIFFHNAYLWAWHMGHTHGRLQYFTLLCLPMGAH